VGTMSAADTKKPRRKVKAKKPDRINPNELKGRDPAQLAIIGGATKAGVHKDRKKEADKYKARKKIDAEE
jgi:hypothetical protein